MKIMFYGGETAGVVTLLTLLAHKIEVLFVIAEDDKVAQIAKNFNLKLESKSSLDEKKFIEELRSKIDFFFCCHGKKILDANIVRNLKCINLHPCLYKYKGSRPIRRLILDRNPKASVASHWMSEEIDQGERIIEKFKKIENIKSKTESDVYSELYPLYSSVIIETIKKISND